MWFLLYRVNFSEVHSEGKKQKKANRIKQGEANAKREKKKHNSET
jgi:high-affinity K+ transport system ATPase subunit B